MCLMYEDNLVSFALLNRSDKNFLIHKSLFDTVECDRIKDLIYKFDVKTVLISLNLHTMRYKNIKEMDIEIKVIPSNTFKMLKPALIDEICYTKSLKCINAILKYIDHEPYSIRCATVNDIDKNKSDVIGNIDNYTVKILRTDMFAQLSKDTAIDLHLLPMSKHPNPAIQAKSSKLSVFGAINHTKTSMGALLLRNWLLFPLLNKTEIQKRQEKIGYIMQKDLSILVGNLLTRCKNINQLTNYFDKNQYTHYFTSLTTFLDAVNDLSQLFDSHLDVKEIFELKKQIEMFIDIKSGESLIRKGG